MAITTRQTLHADSDRGCALKCKGQSQTSSLGMQSGVSKADPAAPLLIALGVHVRTCIYRLKPLHSLRYPYFGSLIHATLKIDHTWNLHAHTHTHHNGHFHVLLKLRVPLSRHIQGRKQVSMVTGTSSVTILDRLKSRSARISTCMYRGGDGKHTYLSLQFLVTFRIVVLYHTYIACLLFPYTYL